MTRAETKELWPENGITLFRERAGLSKSDLAKRIGTTRQQLGRLELRQRELTRKWADKIAAALSQVSGTHVSPEEILYPRLARVDLKRFRNVFAMADSDQPGQEPTVSLHHDLLARMIPNAERHNLRLILIEDDDMARHFARGDGVIVDLDETRPTKPGIYLLDMGGIRQWRFLSPLTSGEVSIRADSPDIADEVTKPEKLRVLGRAKIKISTI